MAKEICPNCNAKMSEPVSFCPTCSRPTGHASESELLEWDLGQWRRHKERSVSSSVGKLKSVTLSSVAVAEPEEPPVVRSAPRVAQYPRVAPEPRVVSDRLEAVGERAPRIRRPRMTVPRLRLPIRRRSEPIELDRVIVLDADNAFVYTSCTSCERADWIVRTTRNEDGTHNYWCVRCSRSFKTDARLRHGWKPFVASGSVIGALATLSIVMR